MHDLRAWGKWSFVRNRLGDQGFRLIGGLGSVRADSKNKTVHLVLNWFGT